MSLTVLQPAAPPPARGTREERTAALEARYGLLDARDLVADLIASEFGRRIALVSSFGTGSAVLLHMLAQADPAAPVLFVDTGKHFGETRRYRDELVARLGLADVRVIEPDPAAVDADDPQGILWSQEPDRCCFVRKVAPLKRALAGFDA
jgi:phosphoadenosine phosphosulfate reductase